LSVAEAAILGPEPAPFDQSSAETTVFRALVQARDRFGGKTVALVDLDERELTYDEIVRAALALGHALTRGTKSSEAVGVMLPTGAASVLSFFALSAAGRVPAMLNFTAGAHGVASALQIGAVKRIVTARRFVEQAKLEPLVASLSRIADIVYLEDVREKMPLLSKVTAVVGERIPSLVTSGAGYDKAAVILYTSGTEGEPKGVALSHTNLLANVEQVRTHLELYPTDVLFNPLPTFHCFGLTVGSIMPLVLGIKVVCHPTPLQPHEIVRRIKAHGATILLSTDTFIQQYARAADPGDLSTLRIAVCGAERLRDETRSLLRRKHDIDPLEGYGVTEAAPVIAANKPDANMHGTVGVLMGGMRYRLDPVEGIPNAGRLFVQGPNVMLGYIKPDSPGVVVPLPEGWHDTGDVVSVDEGGNIAIRGRLKRFAKIGGETVSLAVVENCASAVWPDNAHAAVTLPDGRKGEQIVLITDARDANRTDLVAWVHNHGVPEPAIPRKILHVDAIPILGTGKTDYTAVKKLVETAEIPASEPRN
jgi:acyl-[acyl-carrier-protein]-phospholipid O-acyltransferase/long-chain-fatty-acid--[acyl-carrier-protein] ligase